MAVKQTMVILYNTNTITRDRLHVTKFTQLPKGRVDGDSAQPTPPEETWSSELKLWSTNWTLRDIFLYL